MTVQTVAQYAAHTVLDISPVIRLTNASTPQKKEEKLSYSVTVLTGV